MNKEPINYIIPRIHKLDNCWFIQWIGNEYCISKNIVKEKISKFFGKYFLIYFLLITLLWIISGLFPFKSIEDILRMLLLVVVTGIQSGIAIAEDRENNNR